MIWIHFFYQTLCSRYIYRGTIWLELKKSIGTLRYKSQRTWGKSTRIGCVFLTSYIQDTHKQKTNWQDRKFWKTKQKVELFLLSICFIHRIQYEYFMFYVVCLYNYLGECIWGIKKNDFCKTSTSYIFNLLII